MNIGIIGAGNVGRAMVQASVGAGHSVTITSADAAEAEATANATGARAVGTNRDAVESADITILAVPADAVVDLVIELGDAVSGKTLVDVTNRPTLAMEHNWPWQSAWKLVGPMTK